MAETIKPGKIRFQSLLGESLLGESLLDELEVVILRLLKSQSGKSAVRCGDIGLLTFSTNRGSILDYASLCHTEPERSGGEESSSPPRFSEVELLNYD